jgi:hypothetical protein
MESEAVHVPADRVEEMRMLALFSSAVEVGVEQAHGKPRVPT